MSRYLALGLTSLALLLLSPTASLAEGGTSIAGAPSVVFGQQEFGNLLYGPPDGENTHCIPNYRSWWTVPAIAGDTITIDWEGQNRGDYLQLFTPGISDFTYSKATPVANSNLNDNAKAEVTYTAAQTGNLPLEFIANNDFECDVLPGPYNFTAFVTHTVRLALPRLARLHRTGVLPVSVHTAEGGVITDPGLQVTVQIKRGKSWLSVGSTPVTNSVAAVPIAIPSRYRHQKVSLRAVAHGSSYHSASTAGVRVRVQ